MIFLNPCIDVAFKKIFGSEEHKRVTISFLNSILELINNDQINDIQFLNTEQNSIRDDKKENYLDILCTDQNKNSYIVEVQVRNVKSFDKRLVYYAAKTYTLQLGAAQSYITLKPVIAISILGFTLFPDKKSYKSIHKILDTKTYEHNIKEIAFAFVELPKFIKKESELISNEDKWLYFLKNISKQNNIPEPLQTGEFKEACSSAERMTWSEHELNSYENAIIKATDIQGSLELAEEKGMIKGKLEEKTEIAKNLLAAGVSQEIIIKTTGLTTEQIRTIKNS